MLHFLRVHEFETLYVVGDLIYWPHAVVEDYGGNIELLTHLERIFETGAPVPIVGADEMHPAVGTMEAVTKN